MTDQPTQAEIVAWLRKSAATYRLVNISAPGYAAAADLIDRLLASDNPDLDATDAAHPSWWRGQQHGVNGAVARLQAVLDGKDDGSGVLGSPGLEALRRRLLAERQAVAPVWTQAVPTVDGFYWWLRDLPGRHSGGAVVQVMGADAYYLGEKRVLAVQGGWWSGPLTSPKTEVNRC